MANKQQKFASHNLGGWKSKIRVPRWLGSDQDLFQVAHCWPLIAFHGGEQKWEASSLGTLTRAPIPFIRAPDSWPYLTLVPNPTFPKPCLIIPLLRHSGFNLGILEGTHSLHSNISLNPMCFKAIILCLQILSLPRCWGQISSPFYSISSWNLGLDPLLS